MAGFLSKLLTLGEGRQMKNYEATVERINGLESEMQARSDEELRALTAAFRARAEAGEGLKAILPEAFAAVREASVRTLGLRHFDVQLIGGMALNDGQIAEMKTGEGKTLVSTLAGYLNALSRQQRAHRHRQRLPWPAATASGWAASTVSLGMEVGLIQNGMRPDKRKPAYAADVTYGTNSEFGFDYLRDNMVTRAEARVQARSPLRHRGRGGLHPHRRGAHAAHHLGRGHAGGRDVQQVRPRHARLEAGRGL